MVTDPAIEQGVVGFVFDEDGDALNDPIEDALVDFNGNTVETDDRGYFALELEEGEYDYQVYAEGFSTLEVQTFMEGLSLLSDSETVEIGEDEIRACC